MPICRYLSLPVGVLIIACGGDSKQAKEPPREEPAMSSVVTPRVVLLEGTTEMSPSCRDGSEERCNAIDDDCDGQLDEGCSEIPKTALTVVAMWNEPDDLDLRLTRGDEGAVVNPTSQLKGNGYCDPSLGRLERIEIPGLRREEPQVLTVEIVHARHCPKPSGSEAPPPNDSGDEDARVTATVSVASNGELVGVYNHTVEGGGRAQVLRLEIP